MTSGDEPQLGGQAHDNAPMISSRGTRIIADARGAYVAGNLKALLDLLDAERKRLFKRTIIQVAQPFVLAVMDHSPDLRDRMPEIYEAIPLVSQWLAHPQEHIEASIAELLRSIPPEGTGADDECITALLAAVGYPYPERVRAHPTYSVTHAIHTAYEVLHPPYNSAYHEEIEIRLNQWYLELAWAMLQRRSLPAPPFLDLESLHATLTNVPEMYRQQRTKALIYAMSGDQRAQFRDRLLTQALYDLETCLRHDPRQAVLQDVVSTFRDWLLTQHHPSEEEQKQMNMAFTHKQPGDITRRALHRLLDAFVGWSSHGEVGRLDATSRAAITLAELAAIAGTDAAMGLAPDRALVVNARARANQWQLEAAWAILHDQPVPPVEGV